MKIRNIPFGYEVVGGRYVVNNREAEIIEANPLLSGTSTEFVKKKVAAYCRVSTDSECYTVSRVDKHPKIKNRPAP